MWRQTPRETRKTRPIAQAAAMPAFAPVLSPGEERDVGDDEGVAIVDDAEERGREIVVVGREVLSDGAVGAVVGDDESPWMERTLVVEILAMSAGEGGKKEREYIE